MSERLIIAQPAVDGRPELSVGVLPYDAITLVAKLALSFTAGAPGDPCRILPPIPLSPNRPSALAGAGPGELSYASDFAPPREGVDVRITGHVYAERPAERINAALAIGGFRRAISARASAPATMLPLSEAYLVADAPTEPPLAELPPGARLSLSGLSPRAARREIELPKVTPRAVVVHRTGKDLPIELRCDTLWIDVDAEQIVLVYRGFAPVTATNPVLRVDAWLDRLDAPTPLIHVRRRLVRGIFRFAEEEGLGADGDVPIPQDRLDAARYPLWKEAPELGITLDQYARISAELAEKREPRADTLRRHGLDEHAWGVEERAFLERLAKDAMGGNASLATAYGERFLAAQDALAAPEEAARTLDDYVPVKAAMDRGADPAKALAFFAMTLPQWMRLDRRFSAEAARDPALATEIERRVAAAEVDPSLLADPEIADPEDEYGDDDDDDDPEEAGRHAPGDFP